MPIILDVDPGVDDALAIMFALSAPELEVLGLTIVSGNVPRDQGVENALRLLQFLDHSQVPVFAGADRPLVREPVRALNLHGPSGLGAASLPPADHVADGDGVDFIIETLQASGGDVTLAALGPLTNFARADARVPGILGKAKQLVVMGGSLRAPGNVAPVSEFNFYSDPHAARTVLHSGANLLIVPLDVTSRVSVGSEDLRKMVAKNPSPAVLLFEAATRPAMRYMESVYGEEQLSLHDPVAVTAAFRPHLFEIESHWLDVEIDGELAVGQLVSDRRPYADRGQRHGSVASCCVDVQVEAVRGHFMQTTFAANPVNEL